jgi:uncharacterized protein YjbJ (UPF0337 family)
MACSISPDLRFMRHEKCETTNRKRSQQSLAKGVTIMSGKTDEVKGRIKEAAGALTGNDKLRDEGKTDQAVGKVKQVAEEAVEEVKEAVKKVTE